MSVRAYEVTGAATAGRTLGAAWVDIASGGVLAMLAFPFPIVRMALSDALPEAWLPAFIGIVLVAFALGGAIYLGVTAATLGRTPGMYLFDLGFRGGRPSPWRAAVWALAWTLVALVALVARGLADPEKGAAARLSGLRSGSTGGAPD